MYMLIFGDIRSHPVSNATPVAPQCSPSRGNTTVGHVWGCNSHTTYDAELLSSALLLNSADGVS